MMKLKFLLFFICSPVFAAAPCTDHDANYHDGPTIKLIDGACQVWFCSNNHHWDKYWMCGTWGEITSSVLQSIVSLKDGPQADRDTAWDALPTNPLPSSADGQLALAAAAVPSPKDPPIDGLVTQAVTVYRITIPPNTAPAFSVVGSVKLGIACDATVKIGPYYRIDRAQVTFPKGVIMPSQVYANCDP